MGEISNVGHVLRRQRVIQAVLLPDLVDRALACARSGHQSRWIAGDDVRQAKVISDRPKSTKTRKINPANDQPDEHANITVFEAAMAPRPQPIAVGSGGCPRHFVGVVGLEVQRVRDEALDVGAENREVDPLPVDDGRILLGQDVLGFLHQFVELLLALEVLRLGHDLLEARIDPRAAV